jgi:hypothetical protein
MSEREVEGVKDMESYRGVRESVKKRDFLGFF